MADVIYTHDFKLELGETPKIEGEMEFNIDGQASFITDKALPNLTTEQSRKIIQLFEIARQIYNEFGEINTLSITKK